MTNTPIPTSVTWVLGDPGQFTSVSQLFTPNTQGYEVFAITTEAGTEYAGTVAPVPIPAALGLMISALGGLVPFARKGRPAVA